MNYAGYAQFPFPDRLTSVENELKSAFLALPDAQQLAMLQGCTSYSEFRSRVARATGHTE